MRAAVSCVSHHSAERHAGVLVLDARGLGFQGSEPVQLGVRGVQRGLEPGVVLALEAGSPDLGRQVLGLFDETGGLFYVVATRYIRFVRSRRCPASSSRVPKTASSSGLGPVALLVAALAVRWWPASQR